MMLIDYLEAYGTSEGSERGWDSRGRGRKDPRKQGDVGKYSSEQPHGGRHEGKRYAVVVKNPSFKGGQPFIHRSFDDRAAAERHARGMMGDLPHLSTRVQDRGSGNFGKKFGEGAKSQPAWGYGGMDSE